MQTGKIHCFNEEFDIIEKFPGHFKIRGKDAGKEKNPIFKCMNKDNQIVYLLKCNDDYTLVDEKCLEKLKTFDNKCCTWYKLNNGYIGAHVKKNQKDSILLLHQYLMDYYGNGTTKGSLSVDHLNWNKLDNRLSNLRLVDQSTQNRNRDKRKRNSNAQPLPDGISDLPKYVSYGTNHYSLKDGTRVKRDFFVIEGHPNSKREITSTKSNKVSIHEKYTEILQKLQELDNGNTIEKKENKFGVGISKNKTHFVLDYRNTETGYRFNKKMKLKDNLSEEENLENFKLLVTEKYPSFFD